ncbi:hypothetical protein C8J57DRAFT_1222829 [Mycena rebaudengoi]|nr:hypothetical protein C8J57DRAFT_1222829 [Mycena rebaudengoi]
MHLRARREARARRVPERRRAPRIASYERPGAVDLARASATYVGAQGGRGRGVRRVREVPVAADVKAGGAPRLGVLFRTHNWASCSSRMLAERSNPRQMSQRSVARQFVETNATKFPTFRINVNDTQPVWGYSRQTGHCSSGMVFATNSVENGPNNFAAFQARAKATAPAPANIKTARCFTTDDDGGSLLSSSVFANTLQLMAVSHLGPAFAQTALLPLLFRNLNP